MPFYTGCTRNIPRTWRRISSICRHWTPCLACVRALLASDYSLPKTKMKMKHMYNTSNFSTETNFHDFSIFTGVFTFPGIIIIYFSVAYTPFDSLTSLVVVGKWVWNLPRPPMYCYGLKNGIFPQHNYLVTWKCTNNNWNSHFPDFLSCFYDIFHNFHIPLYFHDWQSYCGYPEYTCFNVWFILEQSEHWNFKRTLNVKTHFYLLDYISLQGISKSGDK